VLSETAGPDDPVVPLYDGLTYHDAISGRVSWGVFGDADDLGTLNFIDSSAVLRGVAAIRHGRRLNLSLPLDLPDPPMSARLSSGPELERRYVHHRIKLRPTINDDYLDGYFLQSSTQVDGLRHVGARGPLYYGGVTEEELNDTDRLGINHIASSGLVTRGVLADVERYGPELGWTKADPISTETLERVLARQSLRLERGDALLVRTGYLRDYLAADTSARAELSEGGTSVGLAAQESMASWLWDRRVAVLGADNPGVEVIPGEQGQFLHRRLITGLGMPLIEWLNLEELSTAFAAERRYDCLVVVVPLNLRRAAGSPANALAVC
jgi:kynurenine formamidase